MKDFNKMAKRILLITGAIILLIIILIVLPRTWSALNPNRPPAGYHFMPPAYLALALGLEELVDTSPDIPENVEEIKNVEYKNVSGKSLQVDIYRPKNITEKLPLLVFIHGGAWKSGNRSDYLVYLVYFAQKGFVTATVSYRLLDDALYPACVEDVRDAVNWFFINGDKYGYDSGRIALIGGSAGAHLAMLAGYGWNGSHQSGADSALAGMKIKAVVDIYGPADLTTPYARTHSLVNGLLGFSWEENPGLYIEASPVSYLDSNDPPTLILHGTSDRLVPVSQSDDLKSRLDSLGVPCIYYRLPLWPHTMDIVKRVNHFCREKMLDFFSFYLLP